MLVVICHLNFQQLEYSYQRQPESIAWRVSFVTSGRNLICFCPTLWTLNDLYSDSFCEEKRLVLEFLQQYFHCCCDFQLVAGNALREHRFLPVVLLARGPMFLNWISIVNDMDVPFCFYVFLCNSCGDNWISQQRYFTVLTMNTEACQGRNLVWGWAKTCSMVDLE